MVCTTTVGSRTRTRRSWLALLTALAVLFAGCGGGDGAATADDEAVGSEGEPQRGGTFTELATAYFEDMDTVTQLSVNAHDVAGPAYSRLLAFKVGEDLEYGSQEIEGDLAESWEVSDDGLIYTFHLRDDVVWHDIPPVNGRPFVARDVVSTMERIKAEGIAKYMLEPVTSVEAPDDHTVVFHLSAPFAPLLNYLAGHYAWILPEEANTGVYDPSTTVIGTGPFILEERVPNVSYTYRANPDYYREGPYVDGYRRLIVPDGSAQVAAFRSGEADIIRSVSPEEAAQLASTGGNVLQLPGRSHLVLGLNQDVPPFDDERVRMAMSLAIDRTGLGETVYGGGLLSGAVVGSLDKWALPQDELAELYPYDPERARELLVEAGVEDVPISIMVSPDYGEQLMRSAQWVVEDLNQVGFQAELDLTDYSSYLARYIDEQFGALYGSHSAFVEPDEWLRAQLFTDASRNTYNVSDPQLDQMLLEQLRILDEEERIEAIHDIQRYVAERMLGWVPVLVPQTYEMVSSRVHDYFPDSRYGHYGYRLLWLDQDE